MRHHGILAAALVISVAIAGEVRGQTAEVSPDLAKLIAGAKAEGALLYSAGGGTNTGLRPVADAMNKHFGLNLKISFTPGPSMPQMASRLIQEVRAGKQPSIDFFLGRPGHVYPMVQQGLIEPFAWAQYFPYITDPMLHYDGRVVTVGSKFNTGAVYNTKLVTKENVPHKLEDVLSPQWKGKVAITPYAAGFSWVALELGMVDQALDYHRRLVSHAGGVVRDAEERVASGEFVMVVLEGNQSAERGKDQGLPVEWALFEDFLGVNFTYMTVPRTSPHPNAARLFIGYLLSSEGQRLLWQYAKEDLYLVEGSEMSKLVKQAQDHGHKVAFDDIARMEDDSYQKAIKELDDKFVKQVRAP
jgi:ABC-type Fe3+ transport system substrate-binding protein